MTDNDLAGALDANPYPGRVVVLARSAAPGGALLAGYALTGRSPASKQRRMVFDGADWIVEPTVQVGHDALRHYVAATANTRHAVYGNGEQVADVAARLRAGAPPAVALADLSYEPDPPIYTPRITAVVDRESAHAWLGAARRAGGQRDRADVTIVALGELAPGDLVLLSTYRSDGETVDTARRHLDLRTQAGGPDELLSELWNALDPRYRIAAVAFPPLVGLVGPSRASAS